MSTPASHTTSVRRLARDFLSYGAVTLLGRIASFVLLPLYSRALQPADYGVLQLLDLVVEVAAIFFTAGLTTGLLRFYFKATSDTERKQVVATAYLMEVGLAGVAAALLTLAAAPLAGAFLGSPTLAPLVVLAAANFLLSSMTAVPMQLLMAQQRPVALGAVSLGKLLLQITCAVTLIVRMQRGPRGMLEANLIANGVIALLLAVWLFRQTRLRPSMAALRDLRRFGVPNQIAWAGSFVLTFGDRFVLQRTRSSAEVGLYGMAYQFGFLVGQLGYQPFLKAWTPQRFQLARMSREEERDRTQAGFDLFNVMVLSLATAVALGGPPMLRLLTPPEYHPAALLIPVIVAAYVLEAWTMLLWFGIDVSEQTKFGSYATWATVIITVLLYLLLIPRLGGLGAALATSAGFGIRMILVARMSGKLHPIQLDWSRTRRLAAVATACVIAGSAAVQTPLWEHIAVSTLCLAMYSASAWTWILSSQQRIEVLGFASKLPLLSKLLKVRGLQGATGAD